MKQLATKRKALGLGVMGGLAVLLLSMGIALATGEMIPRSLIGSGGGEISGDGLELRSAIGQPVAGTVGQGPTLCIGFICGPGASSSDKPGFAVYVPLVIK